MGNKNNTNTGSNKNPFSINDEMDDSSKILNPSCSNQTFNKFKINEKELKARLTPIQYYVTQEKGTERPFSGEYNNHDESGHYLCIVCEQKLFDSTMKFPTHCGWPGFKRPISEKNVQLNQDFSHNMVRTEVTCSNCDAHLGHVFDDGPLPERTRYCINSASLKFIRKLPK